MQMLMVEMEMAGTGMVETVKDILTRSSWLVNDGTLMGKEALLVEEFCPSNEMEKLETEFWNHAMVGANHATYTDRFHELAKLVPHLVTPESKSYRECYSYGWSTTDEAVRCGTFSKGSEKRKEAVETSKQGGSWNDNKRAKKPCHFARDCRALAKQVAPINAVRIGNDQRTCYECGSLDHFRNTCPKLNRAPSQVGNNLTIEGNQNPRNKGNQARGRAFNVNSVYALQDPKVVMGTFSLNDHLATVLFDSGADFSFISTKFVSLLNVKPSIVKPGYVIEVANDLIPLGYGSFDVIVGMDWLSRHKAVIVCHEKMVRIPLASGEVLRVQGEHALESSNPLMSTKLDEQKLDDILVVRDFPEVFSKDLLGLPPQRQVEFHIDLVPGATPVAKAPYRLAPSEMKELSEQLQELQDKGFV
ncbi:putative reverse transcriptase domain-containing protein [Tanacetum coccineum]